MAPNLCANLPYAAGPTWSVAKQWEWSSASAVSSSPSG
jgi:hypothetical protein